MIHGGDSCICYLEESMGDPNLAMGSHGFLNPPNPDWLPHDILEVTDPRGCTKLWRCSRCKEVVTHEEYGDGRWWQVQRHFTPVCPVWPDEVSP